MTDVYGITNTHNLQSFVDSNRYQEIVVARAKIPFGGYTNNQLGITAHLSFSVTIPKLFPIQMITNYGGTNNRPIYPVYVGTDGGHCTSWSKATNFYFYEDANNIYIQEWFVDSGTYATRLQSYISGELYIIIAAPLYSVVNELPDYGFLMYNQSGDVTFNSNFMPLTVRGIVQCASFNPSNYSSYWNSYYGNMPSTVDSTQVPLMPYFLLGTFAHSSWLGTASPVAMSNGQYSTKTSDGFNNLGPFTSDYWPDKSDLQIPIIHGREYFQ